MDKSITKTMLLVMIALVSIMMVAQIAKAGVKNSKHDLSQGSLTAGPKSGLAAAGTDQICIFCHTPHFSGTAAPLWNRTLPTVPGSYQMYTSPTMDMLQVTSGQPVGVSLACLSCHDGTVAFDALLNKPGSGIGVPTGWTFSLSTTSKMDATNSPSAMLGQDLRNDHPISIIYNTTAGVGGDAAFNAAVTGKVGTLPLFGASKNQVECASCHDVHGGAAAPFLRLANTGSVLCLTCHIK